MKYVIVILNFFLLSACVEAQENKPATTNASVVYLTKPGEPGNPFTLTITVLDVITKQSIANAEVFAYHTNHKGDYENNAQGTARIHGTAISDKNGKIIFHTIYPRGYNDSPTGEHIHFRVKANGYKSEEPGLIFADYYLKRYDYKHPSSNKVYLETLNEENGRKTGTAIMYLQKIK